MIHHAFVVLRLKNYEHQAAVIRNIRSIRGLAGTLVPSVGDMKST